MPKFDEAVVEDPTCPRGHPWTPETRYIYPRDGSSHCRLCMREHTERWKIENREYNLENMRRYTREWRAKRKGH